MAKPEILWPGDRLKEFFRRLIASEPTIAPGVRDRLAETCARPINRMLIWSYPNIQETPQAAHDQVQTDHGDDAQTTEPGQPTLADMVPWPALDTGMEDDAPQHAIETSVHTEPAFDPYAFSVVALFKRGGADALLAQLAPITSARHLKELATAQHLSVPRDIDEPEALRMAIVKGAEARIADRRAAGS